MIHNTPAVQPASGYFSSPVFTPVKYLLAVPKAVLYTAPTTLMYATASKVSTIAQSFVGYFVRIGVFSFAEWQRSWFKSKIIDVYNGGPRGLFKNNFSTERLERAFAALKSIGGMRSMTTSKDGLKLDTMILRSKDVKAVIEKNGGMIVETLPICVNKNDKTIKENRSAPTEYADILIPREKGPKWEQFYKDTLLHLGLEKASIQMENGEVIEGFIVNHWNQSNPLRPKEGQICVRFNSPTESFASAKKDIMRRIFAGLDVLSYDPPGTWKSEGIPNEKNLYLAVETMVEKAANEFGYQWSDIWADGFCRGGNEATYAKSKYHDKGINLFVQNTFANMVETLGMVPFPANCVAPYGLIGLQSGNPSQEVIEDGFDNIAKLSRLKGKKGVTIVVNTDTDKTIGPNSHERYKAAADKVSEKVHPILFNHDEKNKDGHRFDVLSVKWPEVVTHIANKDLDRAATT